MNEKKQERRTYDDTRYIQNKVMRIINKNKNGNLCLLGKEKYAFMDDFYSAFLSYACGPCCIIMPDSTRLAFKTMAEFAEIIARMDVTRVTWDIPEVNSKRIYTLDISYLWAQLENLLNPLIGYALTESLHISKENPLDAEGGNAYGTITRPS